MMEPMGDGGGQGGAGALSGGFCAALVEGSEDDAGFELGLSVSALHFRHLPSASRIAGLGLRI